MSNLNRRQFFKSALVNLVQVAGSVTLASAVMAQTQSDQPPADNKAPPQQSPQDVQQRADEVAAALGPDQADVQLVQYRNRGNRRWRNMPWRNGLWRNGPWRNGPWLNGGWPNGGWRNFPWNNGIWLNGGVRW